MILVMVLSGKKMDLSMILISEIIIFRGHFVAIIRDYMKMDFMSRTLM